MLFDLRARGRRRAIKVIYASLALLMGGGLVIFGIGSDVQGGLFDAFRDEQSQLDDDAFSKAAQRAEARVKANPKDTAAWAEIARRRYQVAGQGSNFNENTGAFSEDGMAELRKATAAWERHLALAGDKPDTRVARSMLNAYVALDQLDKAVTTQNTIIDATPDPTAEQYATLAQYAYAANNTRQGDLARSRALELETDKDDREQLKTTLDQIKQQAAAQAVQEATQGATGATGPSS